MELEEKRQHKRINISVPINYEFLETDKKEIGDTLSKDISESGVRASFNKFYPPKTKFLLRINFQDLNKIIETVAEVQWSLNKHFSNNYESGLHFSYVNPTYQNMLREYIQIKETIKSERNN